MRASLTRWLRERFGRAPGRPARSETSSARLGVEVLEGRAVPAANITLTSISLVDANARSLGSVNPGDAVYVRADFATQDLPRGASYRVSYNFDGVTKSSGYLNWAAGSAGTGSWYCYWGTWAVRPGANQVTVTVDPDWSVAETTYADNTRTLTFTAAGAPAAPSLSARAVSPTQVSLSWSGVPGATSYPIDQWVNGSWVQIGTAPAGSTGYTVTRLAPNTTYYFDVGATNSGGTSWANYVTVTTPAAAVAIDHPSAGAAYRPVSGSLFGSAGPSYRDVMQGGVGDCWLLASLAEVAARNPSLIRGMFTYQGTTVEDGATVSLYSVRLYDRYGIAHSVTVDTELPAGGTYYAHTNGVLWVALAEKAYAQANGAGFVTTQRPGSDSYSALDEGNPAWALQAVTGRPAGAYAVNPTDIARAWNAGKYIVLGTTRPNSSYIVPNHAYAVVNFNPNDGNGQPYLIYNPWGAAPGTYNNHEVYGLFTANGTFVAWNFSSESVCGTARDPARFGPGAETPAPSPRESEVALPPAVPLTGRADRGETLEIGAPLPDPVGLWAPCV